MYNNANNILLMIRITGGTAKGQQLKLPRNCIVRPTTDRVREAIFSILASYLGSWSRGLDLYAGSGALGIEALSRGAEWVDFVDQEPRCCAIIKQNLTKVDFFEKAHVYCRSATKALDFLTSNYDIIFMDAPYSDLTIKDVITKIANSELVGDQSIIVVSHASRFPLAHGYDGLYLVKEKQYGDTCISMYGKAD